MSAANPEVRPADKAGSWYAAAPATLTKEIVTYLNAAGNFSGAPVIVGVVPHAGLAFSGKIAALTYQAMAQTHHAANLPIETLIIFGAVHTENLALPALWAQGAWATPLGEVSIDEKLCAAILKTNLAVADKSPHYRDNAIELQLPFIKYLFPRAQIVPIAMPPTLNAAAFGAQVAKLAQRHNRQTVVIASTDLTHYGRNYGFAPLGMSNAAHAWAKENDQHLLNLAQNLQAEAIVPRATAEHSACGAGALAAAVAYARALGATGGEILAHATSYEIMPESAPEIFVGYASMIFRKP